MVRLAILWALVCLCVQAQSPLERAVALAHERRYVEARQALQGVGEPVPAAQRIAFHRLKAAIAAGLNDAPGAAAEMERALALAPADPALLLATAVAERGAEKFDSALRHAGAVGENAGAQALIAGIQETRGRLPEAVAAWREVVRLEPAREEYRANLGAALIRSQNFDAAIDSLRAALGLFPQSAHLTTLVGIAQYAGGDTEDAAATLSTAIALDPAAEPAYRSLTQIVLQASTAPDAPLVKQLCGWNPTVCAALKLRVAREGADATLQAEATQTLERAPQSDIIARCELARAREWTNRFPEARLEMEKCVAQDPSPQNHYRLGLIYQRLGLASLAQEQMEARQRRLQGSSEQSVGGVNLLKGMR